MHLSCSFHFCVTRTSVTHPVKEGRDVGRLQNRCTVFSLLCMKQYRLMWHLLKYEKLDA